MLITAEIITVFSSTPSEYRKDKEKLIKKGYEEIKDSVIFTGGGIYSNFHKEREKNTIEKDKESSNAMLTQKSWKEFRDAGFLWWTNTMLHTFGWALTVEVEDNSGDIVNAYPSHVKFRGFKEDINTAGYIKVSQYMSDNADKLLEESKS